VIILVSSDSDPARVTLQTKHEKKLKRGLFLDRDGVLNYDLGFVSKKSQFRFIPGARKLISWASSHGFIVIIVTNQSGIGRGYFSLNEFEELMQWVGSDVERFKGKIAACYYSSLNPTAITSHKASSFRRKPDPQMVKAALVDFDLNPDNCFLIGDKESDLQAGVQAGIHRVFKFKGDSKNADFVQSSPASVHSHKDLIRKISQQHVCDHDCHF
jgi:D-glycero-D-manno-heptose 1,7-bisphosphate phosphatase